MRDAVTNDYFPVRIDLNNKSPEISWMRRENLCFTDPMFDHTITKTKVAGEPIITTEMSAISHVAAAKPDISPAGFIFHVGRCGSTILSNALQQIKNTIVLSEPSTINSLFETKLLSNENITSQTLKDLLRIYSSPGNCYIKFSSWNTLFLPELKQLYPYVPCIFAFRNPFEVFDSIIAKPVGWMGYYRKLEEKSDRKQSFIDFVISFLKSIYLTAYEWKEHCIYVDYKDGNKVNLTKTLRHFNIEHNDDEMQRMISRSRFYSKDKNKNTLFEQHLTPRYKLTAEVQIAIETELIPVYNSLVQVSNAQNLEV
jgi:hypothetical protein